MNTHTKQQQDKVFETDFIDSQKSDPPFVHLSALSHIYMTWCWKVRRLGVGFLTDNKIRFKHFVTLLLCVCVHNWSVSQWKQHELQIWSRWRNIIFWNSTPEKRTRSRWVLSMLSFMYMTNQNITSVTDLLRGDIALHSAYKIDYH